MKNFSTWCGGNSALSTLLPRCHYLLRIEQLLTTCWPVEVAPHVRVAALAERKLLLCADSSAWAARLRFLSPQIIQFWRREMCNFPEIDTLRVKVCAMPAPAPIALVHTPLSPASAQIIGECAQTIADPVLQRALLRLAGRARRG